MAVYLVQFDFNGKYVKCGDDGQYDMALLHEAYYFEDPQAAVFAGEWLTNTVPADKSKQYRLVPVND